MCRFCEAIGPICRYITDPHWSEGTPHRVPHHPPPPDDLLTEPDQTTSSQPSGLNGHVRARTARPKAAPKRRRLVKTGASPPQAGSFLRSPALACTGLWNSPAACALKVAEAKQAGKRKLDERVAAVVEKKLPGKAVADGDVAANLELVTEQRDKARARARLKEWRAAESSRRLKRARLAEAERCAR